VQAGEAIARRLPQRAIDDGGHLLGQVRRRRGQRADAVEEHLADGVDRVLPGERVPPGEQLPRGHAPRELVGPRVHRAAGEALRGRVPQGAHEHALGGAGRLGAARLPHRRGPGDAEVEDLHLAALADHQVGGLDVAVHQPRVVRGGEHAGGRREPAQAPPQGHVGGADVRGQRLAAHQLHGDEADAALLAHVVDDHRRGVLEGRRQAGLAEELLAGLAAGGAAQHLEGHPARQGGVARRVDVRHPAAPEAALDDVPTHGGAHLQRPRRGALVPARRPGHRGDGGRLHGGRGLGGGRLVGDGADQRLHAGLVDDPLLRDQGPGEIVGEVARRGVPIGDLGGQRPAHHGEEVGGDVGEGVEPGVEAALAHGAEERLVAAGPVGRAEPQHLVEDHAQRVDVGAAVDGPPRGLLGRHVAELALQPGGGVAVEPGGGDAQVGDLHGPVAGEQEVLRRDVAVHDLQGRPVLVAALVGVVQALGGLAGHEGGHVGRDGHPAALLGGEDAAEVDPVDVLHGQDQPVGGVLDQLVDVDDVGVAQAGGDARLPHEHGVEAGVGPVVGEDALDHQPLAGALGPGLLGEEDLGHPAGADPAQDGEVAESFGGFAHGEAADGSRILTGERPLGHASSPEEERPRCP
jgi:hypothetical protein